ncbi:hypothetical protein OG345_14285 [Streptomyces sp. NBC_01220]|uniref:hypothetical protein n=1 Tax=Streptomyces sp. NBC_01220 TaxID=2903781 RepID=UPI00352F46B2|nr:hypothetical protein OG345_14285 [Streptomyces sp. NBC_01220]
MLLAELRPALGAEPVARVLLSTLSSEPILQVLEKGDGERLAVSLRSMVTTLLDA